MLGNKETWWWDEDVQKIIESKKKQFKVWQKSKRRENRMEYKRLCKEAKCANKNAMSRRTVLHTVQIPERSDCSSASDDEDLYQPKNILVYDSDSEVSEVNDDILVIPDSDEEPDDYDDIPLDVRLKNSLISFIVEQSNIYASQVRPNKPANISIKEMEQFIGICLKMSIVHLPSTRHYWGELGIPSIYNVMPLNRFEEIKRFLHFNDNLNLPNNTNNNYDKLFKVRPLIDAVRTICTSIPKEEYLAVDEQIIPTKSRSSLKQYNPKKPHKWGYKVFVLSGLSGFSYDFEIFAGAQTNIMPDNLPSFSVSSNMVVKMAASIPRNCNYKIFFDNWFTSIDLLIYLEKEGILPLGTARLNRLTGLNMPSEKDFKKKGRGTFCEKLTTINDVTLSAVSWYDNKLVNMVSTYVGSQPIGEKKIFFRSEKKYKMVPCPKAIDTYNSYMGGVDSMLGYYRISIKSKKYYIKIFFHVLDLCVVNAWLLYRRVHTDNSYLPLVDFKLLVSEVLCEKQKVSPKRRGRPTLEENTTEYMYNEKKRRRGPCKEIPEQEVRLDGYDHYPIHTNNRIRSAYVPYMAHNSAVYSNA
ncbi:piggyBac transposable element-derived protein 3-like [Daktulosphaira vitifoliae]|uniref:piggyBac transposable element-derived protein 3-like n=1 Tax=Daktulosphaira vitifoliae TaxID=58002 RepID=UPI0021AA74C3|nr:piggyBac transposable element-derived protein 3-like [Daktulosphaira vitifoliae]